MAFQKKMVGILTLSVAAASLGTKTNALALHIGVSEKSGVKQNQGQLPPNVIQVADQELRSELGSSFGSIGAEFSAIAATIGGTGSSSLPPPGASSSDSGLRFGQASGGSGCLPRLRVGPSSRHSVHFAVKVEDITKYGIEFRQNFNKGWWVLEGYSVVVYRNGQQVFSGDSWFRHGSGGYTDNYGYGVVFDGLDEFSDWQFGDVIELVQFHRSDVSPTSSNCELNEVGDQEYEALVGSLGYPPTGTYQCNSSNPYGRCSDANYIAFRNDFNGAPAYCYSWCQGNSKEWYVQDPSALPEWIRKTNTYEVPSVQAGDGWKCNFFGCGGCNECLKTANPFM